MDLSFLQESGWQDRPYPLAEAVQVQQGNKVQLVTNRSTLYRLLSEGAVIMTTGDHVFPTLAPITQEQATPEPEIVAPEVVETLQEEVQTDGRQTEDLDTSRQEVSSQQTEASEPAIEAEAGE